MFGVNWYSVTGRLLQWTLEQPPVPLSGVLYEQGLSQQDQDMQCGATVNGTSGLVAHRLTNLQAVCKKPIGSASEPTPFLYIHCCEYDSAPSTLIHCVLWAVLWIRNDLFRIRIQTKVQDPCGSGSNPCYFCILGSCKKTTLNSFIKKNL